MTNPFDPEADYNVPKGDSKYLKFEDGQTKFLPVDSAVVGFEYWTNDNKPVRLAEKPDGPLSELPGIRTERDGNYRIKHFWAFPVIDAADGKVKVLEITQKSVQSAIRAFAQNEEYGNPVMNYTFTVSRSGQNLDTEYTTMANPPKDIPGEWKEEWAKVKAAGFDIDRLFKNGDPFTPDESSNTSA